MAVSISAVTLLVLELAFALVGIPVYFPTEPPSYSLIVADWWACDEAGCHYVRDAVMPACQAGVLAGRVCAVNRQGYSDADDFTWQRDYEARARVLLLGDSFTFGLSADQGYSFAELLDAELADTVIWNTGIPGGGTNQAIAAFKAYGPDLLPHVTVLGFYQNDFDDNLMPVDSWLNAIDPEGNAVAIRTYMIDEWENVFELEISELEYFRSFWHFPPENELNRLLGSTRLGSLLLRLSDALQPSSPPDSLFERREQVTRDYLQELRDAVAAKGSELLVLLIPGPNDIGNPGMRYQLAREIVSDLEIAYIDPIDKLAYPEDYAPAPDDHWSNSGHQKISQLLAQCIERFRDSGDLADCAHVTIPPN